MVTSIGWSRNGRCLVSGGVDKTVRLWEFVNGQTIARWEGHLGEVSGVAFHAWAGTSCRPAAIPTLLVWDVTLGTSLEQRRLEAATLDQLWDDLASDNNPQGNKALWTLAAGTEDSVVYLSKKVSFGRSQENRALYQGPGFRNLQGARARLRRRWPATDAGSRASCERP